MNQSPDQGRRCSEVDHVQERLIAVASNPRDKAFVSTLGKTGMRITEAVQLEESNIDFERGTLTIVHLKERRLTDRGKAEVRAWKTR